jgi:hypothetical protein
MFTECSLKVVTYTFVTHKATTHHEVLQIAHTQSHNIPTGDGSDSGGRVKVRSILVKLVLDCLGCDPLSQGSDFLRPIVATHCILDCREVKNVSLLAKSKETKEKILIVICGVGVGVGE